MIDALRDTLARNFGALGWALVHLDVLTSIHHDERILRGVIRCPCGGHEYFNFMYPTETTSPEALAKYILVKTASQEHLERDVAEGKLVGIDIRTCCFKGELV